jgi:hypothetical protein
MHLCSQTAEQQYIQAFGKAAAAMHLNYKQKKTAKT